MTAALVGLAVLSLAGAPQASANGYRVGSGDILNIEVSGHPELSLAPTVGLDGQIELPGIEPIGVAELTPVEIATRVATLLARRLPAPPEVRVAVAEYRARFVTVEGSVIHPGRVPLRGATRLIDALIEAGGFNGGASGVVVVRRLDPAVTGGVRDLRVDARAGAEEAGRAELEQPVQHGDVIVALRMEKLAVGGEVNAPGVFEVSEAPTLLAALSAAGGATRFARRVELKRYGTDIVETLDLDALRKGEQPDPRLGGGDSVTVR